MPIFLTFLVSILISVSPGFAQDDDALHRDKRERINLAIRQATLVQSMTQAACFAMAGFDEKQSQTIAREHIDTFSTVQTAFQSGHEYLGVLPLTDAGMKPEIAEMDAIWGGYLPPLNQILHGDHHSVVISHIYRLNAPATDGANALAQDFIDRFGADVFDTELTASLRLAGHHRMLPQRAIKEMCFTLFGLGGANMPHLLQRTLQEFDQASAHLTEGSAAFPLPPNARLGRN